MAAQTEPLSVFLKHRIKSIISKEWWDFVVNVNNMNSDHASLLYSVANLCPSFQNFLRTREKELTYILKKRPQVKPRIFSGSERTDLRTATSASSVVPPSTTKKSCSAELDQILNDLYPNERSIIRGKPRTYGPISKQKKIENMKKFQAYQAQKPQLPNVAEENHEVSLSKVLREDENSSKSQNGRSSTPSSVQSTKNCEDDVEYAISNLDVNKNKVSLNMKKIKKIIKVKKKIMTYTDSNDVNRTKYILESETPELKRELIKKYRLKKSSVVLRRLTHKDIKRMTEDNKTYRNVARTSKLGPSPKKKDAVPSISLKFNLGKGTAIPVERIKVNDSYVASSNSSSSTRVDSNTLPIQPDVTQNDNLKKTEPESKLEPTEKISNGNKEEDSSSHLEAPKKKLNFSPSTVEQKVTEVSNAVNVIQGPLNSSAVKSEDYLKPKQTDINKSTVSSEPLQSVIVKKESVQCKPDRSKDGEEKQNHSPVGVDSPKANPVDSSNPAADPPHTNPVVKPEKSSSSSKVSNGSSSESAKADPNTRPGPDKEQDNSSSATKNKLNQKENLAIKMKPKELDKELKTVYCHGGIVPLGKSSGHEKSVIEKSKHLLSLKEKRHKEIVNGENTPVDPVSPLKEKNIKNVTNEPKEDNSSTGLPITTDNVSLPALKSNDKTNNENLIPTEATTEGTRPASATLKEKETGKSCNGADVETKELPGQDGNSIVSDSNKDDKKPEEDLDVDDIILIESPPEVIEIHDDSEEHDDSDGQLDPGVKIKIENCFSECDVDSFSQIEAQNEEPSLKRPRLELNLTKVDVNNRNCKLCHLSFTSDAEMEQHYSNGTPKCSPNLQALWDNVPELPILN